MNETFATLFRIASIFCNDPTERETFEVELNVGETWLKYGISNHLCDSSNCVAHVILNGLALPINGSSIIENGASSECSDNYSESEDGEPQESDDEHEVEMQEISSNPKENTANDDAMSPECIKENKDMPDFSVSCTEKDASESCESCKHLFYLMDHLKKLVKKSGNIARKSALRVLRHCQKKIKLFMGHKIRVKNQ